MFDSHAAPDLEARLPAAAAGIALAKFSITGADIQAAGGQSVAERVLQAIGRPGSDLQLAVALDPSSQLGASVTAARIGGVDGATLQAALASAAQNLAGGNPVPTSATVGDKAVLVLATGADAPPEFGAPEAAFLYTSGEVVYLVLGTTIGATAILEALT